HPELLQAPQARLGGKVAHHPNRVAAFAVTCSSSSEYETPRAWATNRAVSSTNAGWLRSLRTSCGVRYGASVSTSRRSSGTRSAAAARSWALGYVTLPANE